MSTKYGRFARFIPVVLIVVAIVTLVAIAQFAGNNPSASFNRVSQGLVGQAIQSESSAQAPAALPHSYDYSFRQSAGNPALPPMSAPAAGSNVLPPAGVNDTASSGPYETLLNAPEIAGQQKGNVGVDANGVTQPQPTASSGEPYNPVQPPVISVNPFIETASDRQSTFALDVDTGSYVAARNYINNGMLPPPGTVRVEEFVNYFRPDYAVPEGDTFGVSIDCAPSPFNGGKTQIVRVGVQAKRIDNTQRKDAVLTFVVDISGSMAEPNRLPLVKEALRLLVNELRDTDQVAIVVYGDEARTALDNTSASQRERIMQVIDSLQNEGSTNVEAGLRMGYALAAKHYKEGAINRVILCSDGVANVGATSPDAIRQSIKDYTKRGITLTTVGFGMGDYNDELMEQLADDGDGNYAYVDTLAEAQRIFVENLTGTLQVVAKDAKVQVEFNPATVVRYRLIGYENRDVADIDFRNDKVDAGEIGAGHSVTALYEVELVADKTAGAPDKPILTVHMRYADPKNGQVREMSKPLTRDAIIPDFTNATARFQLAVAVAGFAEALRSNGYTTSEYQTGPALTDVLAIAQRLAPRLVKDVTVQEFAQLVQRAAELKQ